MNQNPPQQFYARGGSASDKFARGGNVPFGMLKKGTMLFPSGKKTGRLYRIMPGRDMRLNRQDAAWLTSVAPYRDREARYLDDDTKTPPFLDWFQALQVHRRMGRSGAEFVSPHYLTAIGAASGTQGNDPLIDCHNVAQASNNPQWVALTKKVEGVQNSYAVLPFQPAAIYAMNALFSDQNPHPSGFVGNSGVLAIGPTAFIEFKTQLSWPTTMQAPPRDPNWPEYLFGDITSPNYGLAMWSQKRQIGTVSPWALNISPKQFEATHVYPVPLSQVSQMVGMSNEQQLLADRLDLTDVFNVWNIPTQQEIVDWMISDGAFPVEIIRLACSHYANIPANAGGSPTFANAVTGFGGPAAPGAWQPPGTSQAPAHQQPWVPPTQPWAAPTPAYAPAGGAAQAPPSWQAPTAMPVQQDDEDDSDTSEPAPYGQASASNQTFWVTLGGGTPMQRSRADVENLPVDQFSVCQMTPDANTPWQAPAAYGIHCRAATPPPAPQVPQQQFAPQPSVQQPYPAQPFVPVQPTVPQHFAQPQYAPQPTVQQPPVQPQQQQFAPQPPVQQPPVQQQFAPQPTVQQPPVQPQPQFAPQPPVQPQQPQFAPQPPVQQPPPQQPAPPPQQPAPPPQQFAPPPAQPPAGAPPGPPPGSPPPAAGAGLTPEQQAELQRLMQKVSTAPSTMDAGDYAKLTELTRLTGGRPQG